MYALLLLLYKARCGLLRSYWSVQVSRWLVEIARHLNFVAVWLLLQQKQQLSLVTW